MRTPQVCSSPTVSGGARMQTPRGLPPTSDFSLVQTVTRLACSWDAAPGEPSAGRAQGQVGKCSAAPGPPGGHSWPLTGPRGAHLPPHRPTVLYSDLDNDTCFRLSLYLSQSGQSRLLLPGTTYQIDHLHPAPCSGSAFEEPSPRPPANETH